MIKKLPYFTALFLIIFTLNLSASVAKDYEVSSPSGNVVIHISVGNNITYSVNYQNKTILNPSAISVNLGSGLVLGENPTVDDMREQSVNKTLHPVIPLKSSEVSDHYNQLTLQFRNNYSVVFRAYDSGAAYRFEIQRKGNIRVYNEQSDFNFAGDYRILFPEEESFHSHYERMYTDTSLSAISSKQFCSLPATLQTPSGVTMTISEAGLYDYPNMFLYGTEGHGLTAAFPKKVLEAKPAENGPDRNQVLSKKADYIAETSGNRPLTWRVLMLAPNAAGILENTLTYNLARSSQIDNTSWINPGKVAWDWWNANNVYDVDFKSGINTDTYKYYVDFAAKYGLPYIILDEGWSNTTNLLDVKPGLDMNELTSYAKQKGVGLILWMVWKPLDKNMEKYMQQFEQWGVKGIKVDFMQRGDQDMVNFYERTARTAAKHHLMVDFHGAYKPSGLQRAYPNVMSFEGVKGMENDKWSKDVTPEHDVKLAFTRMIAGPMDFTPGAMHNATKQNFRAIFTNPMSQGTRVHQVAMYAIYESGLQMLCDSPTHYYEEPETTEFISRFPVTWDETRVLDAQLTDYLVVARRKGDTWYLGAMTDWTPRDLQIDLSFLKNGNYHMDIMQDGVNANRYASDYKKVSKTVSSDSRISFHMAPGGGWAAIIKPE